LVLPQTTAAFVLDGDTEVSIGPSRGIKGTYSVARPTPIELTKA